MAVSLNTTPLPVSFHHSILDLPEFIWSQFPYLSNSTSFGFCYLRITLFSSECLPAFTECGQELIGCRINWVDYFFLCSTQADRKEIPPFFLFKNSVFTVI